MKNIVKPEFYDEFRCIADQCPFTCCGGWDISVDTETYHKWKSNEKQSGYFMDNINVKKYRKEAQYYIKMGRRKSCPFLDEKGLCNIVTHHGEEYLSNTCKAFPRIKNSFGALTEYSISCACPTVVDTIKRINGKMKFFCEGNENSWNDLPLEYQIRETMIAILQNSGFYLKERVLLIFHMLLTMKNELLITKNMINQYQSERYLHSLIDIWSGTRVNRVDSCLETNELFLDIIQNYRKEKQFSDYLKNIAELAEDLDVEKYHTCWENFEAAFGQYETLLENCLVTKIFANGISEDIDETILSFQILVTEYLMVRYSVFLQWLINEIQQANTKKEIDYTVIRDNIVIYSRIIGYNSDGIREFWEESFDEAVWEFGYMLLLMN